MEEPASAAVNRADRISEEMIQGKALTSGDVDRAIHGLQEAIERLDRKANPAKQ